MRPHDHETRRKDQLDCQRPAIQSPGEKGPYADRQQRYAIRAGIEATLSQNIRTCGLRRSRYRGLARTHVQHVLTALACNLTRVADWIAEPTPTRHRSTRFNSLCTTAA
ncbi:transposase [Stenotrophomonas sp. NPDC087984]